VYPVGSIWLAGDAAKVTVALQHAESPSGGGSAGAGVVGGGVATGKGGAATGMAPKGANAP
jgi:hypothetical protein